MNAEQLAKLFPPADAIPEAVRIASPIEQRAYLIGGELRRWDGPFQPVISPVCVQGSDGRLEQVRLGSYPLMSERETDAALEAAVEAYDSGRGKWPTMSVTERIGCIEAFTKQMVSKKQVIVKLITWEIGKSLADS